MKILQIFKYLPIDGTEKTIHSVNVSGGLGPVGSSMNGTNGNNSGVIGSGSNNNGIIGVCSVSGSNNISGVSGVSGIRNSISGNQDQQNDNSSIEKLMKTGVQTSPDGKNFNRYVNL